MFLLVHVKFFHSFVILVLVLGLIQSLSAIDLQAETDDASTLTEDSELTRINLQIEEEHKKLEHLRTEFRKTQSDFDNLKNNLAQLKVEHTNILNKITQLDQERLRSQAEIKRLKRAEEDLQKISKARVRALYEYRHEGLFEHALAISDNGSFMRNALYLARIRAFDGQLLLKMQTLSMEIGVQQEKLQVTLGQYQTTVETLTRRREFIGRQLEAQKVLKSQLEIQRQAIEESLLALKAQALRIETVIASLTGENVTDKPDRGPRNESRLARASLAPLATVDEPFQGPGLSANKKSLPWPIPSKKIVQIFGAYKDSDSGLELFHHGIKFESEEGVVVSSIAPGKVIFVGRMPNLGTVVIPDHGQREYSLYADIGELQVNKGAELEGGSPIGYASRKNLYFEIRRNGQALDPMKFLRRLG